MVSWWWLIVALIAGAVWNDIGSRKIKYYELQKAKNLLNEILPYAKLQAGIYKMSMVAKVWGKDDWKVWAHEVNDFLKEDDEE